VKTVGKLKDAGVTWVAILVALPLIVINNLWITVIEVRWYALDGTCLPLFVTPIFILFILSLCNLVARRIVPRIALSRGELLTIYIMIVMAACLASHDMIQNLFGTLGHPARFASEANQYEKLFWRYLPHNMYVWDKAALQGFYGGGVYPFVWPILRYWVVPLAIWGSLVIVLISMMLAINIIIRKQWTEHEKLVFPLVQLPIAMTAEDSGRRFFASKLMWIGFGVAFLIGLINGLHVLYPSMPVLEGVKAYSLLPFFPNRPWNAVARFGNGFNITMYPFTIGLVYFIPLDLSFSCWFFYVARKVWQVIGAAMGWDAAGTSGFPYWDAQSSGAWLALSIIIVLGTVPHLKTVWRQAFRTDGTPEEMSEAGLYRKSLYVLIAGGVFLILLSRYMGLPPILAVIFFALYFLLSIAMTRVRAELGTPHEIVFVNPQQIMLSLLGFNVIGAANMTVLQSMYWFNRCYRSHPMPNQLEAMKMAEGTQIRLRPLILVLMLAAVVGLLTSYWANLYVTYEAGASAKCMGFKWWVGAESFDRLANWIRNKPTTDLPWMLHMIGGALVVIGLKAMRGAFVGWPFHPAGYALAISYAMDYFWFAFFVGWLVKLIIVRYGGMRLHNTMVPFFLGLVLGDFTIGSIWAIIGPIIHTQCYKIFI